MPKKKTTSKKVSKKISAVRKPAVTAKKVLKKLPVKSSKSSLVSVKKSSSWSDIGKQLIIAGSAVCVMLFLAAVVTNTYGTRSSNAQETPSTIGLEHEGPLSLAVLFARKGDAGYVSISNESNETIYISLPSAWKRTEVSNTTLDAVKQEIPVFGFTRWTLPGKAGMKLLTDTVPSAVFFDSTSSATAAVDLKTIDLSTLSVESKVVLVQKQTLVPLWVKDAE